MRKILKNLLVLFMLLCFCTSAYGGAITRWGGNFSTHDELADLTKVNHQLNDLFTWSSDVDHENIADEGIRNANFDADEAFSQESWNNAVKSGHFPTWSSGSTSVPDGWTAEGTPTYLQHCPSTQAPSQLDDTPIFYSVRLTAVGADNEGIAQTFNCFSSMTYTVSLKVKCDSGDVASVVIDDDGSMDSITKNYTDVVWQSENDKKNFTFTTSSDSEQVTIKLLAKNDGDIVMFSEVQVTEGRLLKGYQYQDTDADTLDGIHASTTATADVLIPWSAIPRTLWTWGAADANKGLDVITGTTNAYVEKMEQYIYLPKGTVDIEIYAHGWCNNNAGSGYIQVVIDNTDTFELGNPSFPDTTPNWDSSTETMTVNSAAAGWHLFEVELKESTGSYEVYVDALSIAYK